MSAIHEHTPLRYGAEVHTAGEWAALLAWETKTPIDLALRDVITAAEVGEIYEIAE